jgi:hypothetical protein
VADLAEDLRRFLRDEPVRAQPPSTLYQLRKLTRRHRRLFAGLALVFLLLAAGTFGDTVALAPGPYTLSFQHRGEPVETELWIHADRTTWVRLNPRAAPRGP